MFIRRVRALNQETFFGFSCTTRTHQAELQVQAPKGACTFCVWSLVHGIVFSIIPK